MPTWTLIQSDNFTRSNTTASANPGSVGSSWIDEAGSIYNISSNQLLATTSNTSGYSTQILARPSSEKYQDQKVLLNFPGNGQSNVSGSTVVGAVTRWQSGTGNHYEAVAVPNGTTAYIYKVVGGIRSQLTSISCSGWDSSHTYSLELDCYGVSPTTLAFTLIDTTSSVTRGSGSITDSETTLQNATGVSGVAAWSVSGGSGTTVLLTSAATYYSPTGATALNLTGPTTGSTGVTSSNFTVTANGTLGGTTTVTPSTSASGTFSPTTVTLSATITSATFTYTAATATTATITVSATGLTSATGSFVSTTPSSATALTITGPGSGTTSVASSSFTVTANGSLSGSKTVTLTTSGSGSFSPTSLTLTTGTTSGVFTYTAGTSSSVTLTAAASGLTSGTIGYTSTVRGTIPTAPIITYSTPYTTGTTPSTFVPQFGAGDAVAARTLYGIKTGFVDWASANSIAASRLLITEVGIPGSSIAMTEPYAYSSYEQARYFSQWNNVFQQWYEYANRVGINVTAWLASQWRVPLEAYTTDDGSTKVINIAQTQSAIIENNISNTIYQRGIAFAGGDFADSGPSGGLNRGSINEPGAAYYYPKAGNWPLLAARGVTLIRFPIRWERIQPTLKQPLDLNEMALLIPTIQAANAAGCKVLLDIHNYARYDTTPTGVNQNGVLMIGQNAPTSVGGTMTSCYVDLWTRLATYMKANCPIWGYDIMNEPHDLPNGVSDWQTASQLAVEAIRVVDQNVIIAVEGYAYSTTINWSSTNGSAWLTETIPAGQTGAGSARNTDPLIYWNGHHYFNTIPNGNSGEYDAGPNGTTLGNYSAELAAATSAGYVAWSTGGYVAPTTDITSQTGLQVKNTKTFAVNPGVYSTTNLNGYVAGSNTITIPYTSGTTSSMKIVTTTTSDQGAVRASLTGSNVSRVGIFPFQIDAGSVITGMSGFNIFHAWQDDNATDFVEIRVSASGSSGYTTTLAIPGAGGATASGSTVLPIGSNQTFKLLVTDTNFQLFLNGSGSAEVTLTSSNTGKNIGGYALGKFYGTQALTLYYGTTQFGNNVTVDSRANGGSMTPITSPPSVTLATNITSGTAPQSLTLTAIPIAGTYPVATVDFYQGATKLGTATTTPFTYPVAGLAAGTWGFTAVVTDTSGLTASSNLVTVTVSSGTPTGPTSVPSVTLALSGTTGVSPASVTLTATPTTTSGYVSLVEFFNSGTKVGQATSTPWSFTQTNLSAGTYSFTAKATDSSGNNAVSTAQGYVVTTTPTSTVTPPTVVLTVTVTNPVAPAAATLAATATATGASVSNVAFYQNGVLLTTDLTPPYTYGVASLNAGTYTFTAIVTDSNGSQTTSGVQTLIITPVTVITTGTGTTTSVNATTQEVTPNTQGTLLDIKRYIAAQPGRNDASVPQAVRDQLINDARDQYYTSRRWGWLLRSGFSFITAQDSVYPTLYSAPLPLNRNKVYDLGPVYDTVGRPVKKFPVDQLLRTTAFVTTSVYGYAIDENRGVLLTTISVPLFGDYWLHPKRAALDGSEDLIQEPAPDVTAIKYLGMALTWVGNERDEQSMDQWMQLYTKQYQMDVMRDAGNQAPRQYRSTKPGQGFTKRGYTWNNPPNGYGGRWG